MNRLSGLIVVLAAGLAAGVAWGATPPIVVGASTTTVGATTTTAPSPLAQGMSVGLSSGLTGLRPIAFTVKLHYEMQCGYPGSGSLAVTLPPREQVPRALVAGSALLDGKRVDATLGPGKTVRVTLPPRPAVMCDVIGPGTLTLVVEKAADFGNPAESGTYAVSARAGTHAFKTTVRIGK